VPISVAYPAIGDTWSSVEAPYRGGQNQVVTDQGPTIAVRPYDQTRGAVADVEGGDLTVSLGDTEIVIAGSPAGLRDLARWCLVISDEAAPSGVHIHLDPNLTPLTAESLPIIITRL
jgi:hypothetical protein